MTDLTPLNRVSDLTDVPAADLADNAHTYEEHRLDPGVYASTVRGHALLVGTNQRSLTVVDLGGVIQVAGIDVIDPDHLGALADHLAHVADRLRNRQSPAGVGAAPTKQLPAALPEKRKQQAAAGRDNSARTCLKRRTRRPSTIEVVDLLSLIEDKP